MIVPSRAERRRGVCARQLAIKREALHGRKRMFVAKGPNRSLLYSTGPQLGPNRRQSNSPVVGCELFKEVRQTSFSSGFTFFWTKAETPEGTPPWPWRHKEHAAHSGNPNFRL